MNTNPDSSDKRVAPSTSAADAAQPSVSIWKRFPDILGLCGGTFDNPDWFDRNQGKCRHIFTRSAQRGVVLPAGVDLYQKHALQLDGTPNHPTVLAHALMVSRDEAG